PPTDPPPTTPPPGTGGCSASVSLNSWNGGFVATVKVTAGSAGTSGWNVGVTLASGASVTNTWSATASGSTGTVRFANVDYNGRLGAGQVTEFGFQGTGSGAGITPTCTAS
ncbi:cellulose binding domain-containing protein, partial [Micromonospora arida]